MNRKHLNQPFDSIAQAAFGGFTSSNSSSNSNSSSSSSSSSNSGGGNYVTTSVENTKKSYEDTAINAANKAFTSAQNSGLEGSHNGEQDAYRHCVASGELARETNVITANVAGAYHEISSPNPIDEHVMDLNNNLTGSIIGSQANSFSEVESECLSAVSDGRLQTSL